MEKIKNSREEENKTEIYTLEEAEIILSEKKEIWTKFLEKTGFKGYGICVDINKMCFSDLPEKEINKHIFYHILGGSSITGVDQEYIYDERDRKAEEMLKEKLEKLKLEE